MLPHKAKGRRRAARAGDIHPKGVRVEAIGLGLAAVGYRPCRAKRVRVVILARSAPRLPYQPARPLHVGGRIARRLVANGSPILLAFQKRTFLMADLYEP